MLKLKLQYSCHLMRRADSLEKTLMLGKIEGRRRRGRHRMRWLGGITDGQEFEQAPEIGDGQGSLVYCRPWGYKELDMTEHQKRGNILVEMRKEFKVMIVINYCRSLGFFTKLYRVFCVHTRFSHLLQGVRTLSADYTSVYLQMQIMLRNLISYT